MMGPVFSSGLGAAGPPAEVQLRDGRRVVASEHTPWIRVSTGGKTSFFFGRRWFFFQFVLPGESILPSINPPDTQSIHLHLALSFGVFAECRKIEIYENAVGT